MAVVAIIPARGGSKGIPGKNLAVVGGRSLVGRSVLAAQRSGVTDEVIVSTDSEDIGAEALRHGATVVDRPADLAGDTASSESAVLHALERSSSSVSSHDDVVLFIQCTSPFIDPAGLARATERLLRDDFDVVFAATRSHGFIWRDDGASMVGVNHDHSVRQRRQDRPTEYLETGAFYAMRADRFLRDGHRFGGRIGIEQVLQSHAIEIDDPNDLERARMLAGDIDPLGPTSLDPSAIDALVMDFDGVHTDNSAYVDQHGMETARVNRSDGMGIAMARESGLRMLILSTETSAIVERRAEKLRVECMSGCEDKLTKLKQWARKNGLERERIAYIGNDLNDLECLQWVGWPIVVSDAHPSLLHLNAFVTSLSGGHGSVREVTDVLVAERRKEETYDRN